MLAGRIRLKTFLIGVAALGVACGGAAVVLPLAGLTLFTTTRTVEEAPPTVERVMPVAPIAPVSAAATPATATAPAPREADAAVLRYLGKPLGSDKKKDVTSGRPYKVNVYQDAGQPVANRAKLDLDRDEKWDEKFTWKDDTVERQVAPADDESYTETYVWTGADWARK